MSEEVSGSFIFIKEISSPQKIDSTKSESKLYLSSAAPDISRDCERE